MLGRGDEARPYLDRVLQIPEDQVDAINSVLPSLGYVDLAWGTEDPALAHEHAARALALATKSGNAYLRVYAQACRGVAHTLSGNPGAALEDLSGALRFARSRKAGLENEVRILADLANACRLNGDLKGALEYADEALALAAVRRTRATECLAHIVRAEILSASRQAEQKAAARESVARAEALMRENGLLIYQNAIQRLADGASSDVSGKSRKVK